MKTDYSEEIRRFLKSNYEPVLSSAHENEETEIKSLSEIHSDICSILPKRWISESDVFDILSDLGFKSFKVFKKPIIDRDGDEDKVIVPGKTYWGYFLQPI
ncbi:hypothetical protein MG296_10600 [Flavobacteriaceae bacterium TK19130]|nr:hypothetical protein [Thermobacterium salinum]